MITRPALESDLPSIHRFHRALYLLHHEQKPDMFKHVLEYGPGQSIDLDLERTLVCVAGDSLVGFLAYDTHEVQESVNLHPRKMMVIFDLFVDESSRHRGVATKLMVHVEAIARELGCDSMEIPVFSFNTDAQRFYESQGCKEYVRRYRKPLALS